ncbi:hypothetical protein PS467_39805 [Streptomyces luomodiensis]|uniref:Chaplin domain-containing protein n=1 Tax=Streptomyces luomodiensis TaxID=3026192 RepID=A0ABY9VAV8_9ACTN|nr:hypothetical protein [Streptomyces sp. SCA4-21]WNF01055.1 hypothetical protein PS467_39805 [Streptomyces sp. SCA4-21]
MNIGKTAALVTAAAGAVVFGGADAGALGPDTSSVEQTNDCEASGAAGIGGAPAQPNCVNFAQIFGEPHGLTQVNHCDSSGVTSTANVIVTAPVTEGAHCANIAVSAKPSKSRADQRGAHGGGHR